MLEVLPKLHEEFAQILFDEHAHVLANPRRNRGFSRQAIVRSGVHGMRITRVSNHGPGRDRTLTPRSQRSEGFTLLEVMIAFVIAGIAVVALIHASGGGLAATRAGTQYAEAVSRARSHLAVVSSGTAITPGDSEGDDGGGFHWRLRIVPEASTVVALPGPARRPGLPVTLYAVSAWISWRDGGNTRAIRVDTAQVGSDVR